VRVELARIAAIPLFDGLTDAELAAVAAAASELAVETGAALANAGDLGHALFVVEEGAADVVADGTKIGNVGPGDLVGEVAVLRSGRRTATVVATSPMRVLALFKRDVWALERTAPEASRRIRSALDEREPFPPTRA
jgi:CRP-like cAMP-binding protein